MEFEVYNVIPCKTKNFRYVKSIFLHLFFLWNCQLDRSKELETTSGWRITFSAALCPLCLPFLHEEEKLKKKTNKQVKEEDFCLSSRAGLGSGNSQSAPSSSGVVFGYRHCLELLVYGNKQIEVVLIIAFKFTAAAAAAKSLQSCPTLQTHRGQPTRLRRPWDSPGKSSGVGCHFLLQNSPQMIHTLIVWIWSSPCSPPALGKLLWQT